MCSPIAIDSHTLSKSAVPATPPIEAASSKPARPIRARLVIVSVLSVSLLGVAAARLEFGSIPVAVLYLRGERLILTPTDLRVDGLTRAKPVLVTAEVRNFGPTPVRVLGSAVNCSCVSVKEMPEAVPAGGRCAIVFEVHALPGKPDVDQQVVFFTDHPTRPCLGVHVKGQVRD